VRGTTPEKTLPCPQGQSEAKQEKDTEQAAHRATKHLGHCMVAPLLKRDTDF
jgi:hypothetical protein